MLVISRKEGEEIIIGSKDAPIGIIRFVRIKSGYVKVALDFPKDVQVNRAELLNEDDEQQHT